MDQLNLSCSSDHDRIFNIFRLIAKLGESPAGLRLIEEALNHAIEQSDLIYGRPKPQQPYTSVPIIVRRIEDSADELRQRFPKPVHIAVLRQWYEDKYELLPGDTEELRQKKGGKNLRWWSQFGNAISDTNVLVSTERNWYAVVPLRQHA